MSLAARQPARIEAARPVAATSKPILFWAPLGAICMAVIVITVAQWILSPEFKAAPTGPDPMPGWMPNWLLALQIFFSAGAVVMWWIFLIRPWIKAGHITWDGLFLLACITIWYQDPIDNYFNFTFTYNAHFPNRSAWCNFIPGWVSPRAENFAEPYTFMGSFFLWGWFYMTVAGCWLINQMKKASWLPQFGMLGQFFMVGIFIAVFDFLIESLFTHTGVYAYVAVFSPLSVFVGTPAQFPLYESTGVGFMASGMTLLRYYRDDYGYSFVERGLQHLRAPAPVKRLLSFFALVAAVQVAALVLFYGQYQPFAIKADSFAKYPSYQLLEICGKGTPIACPTAETPMPKRGSLAIAPDDPRLSPESRRN